MDSWTKRCVICRKVIDEGFFCSLAHYSEYSRHKKKYSKRKAIKEELEYLVDSNSVATNFEIIEDLPITAPRTSNILLHKEMLGDIDTVTRAFIRRRMYLAD